MNFFNRKYWRTKFSFKHCPPLWASQRFSWCWANIGSYDKCSPTGKRIKRHRVKPKPEKIRVYRWYVPKWN